MDKVYKNQLTKEQMDKLRIKYGEILKDNYEIEEVNPTQVCRLTEFLIAQSNRYDNDIYMTNRQLQEVAVIMQKDKNRAVLINLNEEGKTPAGEFGIYDFEKNQFQTMGQTRDLLVKKLGIQGINSTKQDEVINTLFKNELDAMDKLATMDINLVIERKKDEVRKVISEKIDETNHENGKTKEEREALEKENNTEDKEEQQITVGEEKNNKKTADSKIPEDVQKACKRLGITNLKSYFYVRANELGEKIDGTRVNKNGNKVLILEVPDAEIEGPNKYYGIQNEKMVLYGREETDEAIKEVTGNVTKMGTLVKPLKSQEDQYIEYEDSQGLVICEKIEDKDDLSMQEIDRYRKGLEDTLEKYSNEIYKIKENDILSAEEKIARIQAMDDWCDKKTTELALQNDISMNDDRNIDAMTDEHTEDMQEEIESENENTRATGGRTIGPQNADRYGFDE